MRLTHLGHESWEAEHAGHRLLVDPVLEETFGTSPDLRFTTVPSRKLSPAVSEDAGTVVLTSEHFQHLDLRSLMRVPRSAQIIVSTLVSRAAREAIATLGFRLVVVPPGRPHRTGPYEFLFVPPSPQTVFWDSRVTSLCLGFLGGNDTPWLFFQSDTHVNSEVQSYLPESWRHAPSAAVLVSHLQFWDQRGFSPFDNYIGEAHEDFGPRALLSHLSAVVPLQVPRLQLTSCYILSGGGYDRVDVRRPVPRVDNGTLSDALRPLGIDAFVQVPKPGQVFEIVQNCLIPAGFDARIRLAGGIHARERKPFEVLPAFADSDFEGPMPLDSHCFEVLRLVLLSSKTGHALLFADTHLGRPVGPQRFCIQVLGRSSLDIAFDFAEGRFLTRPYSGDQAIRNFPQGIRLARGDIQAIFEGRSTVAEVCHAGSLQWHTAGFESSPIALLYSSCAEFVPNGLATRKYGNILSGIR